MADAVEIYLCKPGQKLKEGRIVMADDIRDKNDAKADTRRRCKSDPTLERIAYYRINEAGDFKMLYSHKVEDAASAKPKPKPQAKRSAPATKKTKRMKPKKKGFWGKIKALFGG